MKFHKYRTVARKWAAGFLGAMCVPGFFVLSLTCELQPLGDSRCAAAEPDCGWPYCLARAGLAAMERPAT